MPENRLHINVSEGIIEAEGDPAFVKQVYADFKDYIPVALANKSDKHELEQRAKPKKATATAVE